MMGGMHTLAGGVARSLHDTGAHIIFAHTTDDTERAQALSGEIGGRTQAVSFLNPETLKGEIAAFGQVDIAIIASSRMAFGAFLDTSPSDWDEMLAHNFEQATYVAQAAANHMIAQGMGGRIIFLSTVASLMPFSNRSAVGTSLAALHALAKMAAVDLAPHGITVNVVAVGWVEAEWTAKFLTPERRAAIEYDIPLGWISRPKEVGDLCCFLASDLSGYITGAIIPLDGGYLLTKSDGSSPLSE
jgi:NAD(P)-dependent dehydrogenase (short-subunit alcohol dehydrogenase family)